jgi:hypothetical protein
MGAVARRAGGNVWMMNQKGQEGNLKINIQEEEEGKA